MVDRVALGPVSSEYFGFTCQLEFYQLFRFSPVIRGWYNGPFKGLILIPHKKIMAQSPSASETHPRLLWNTKFHYRAHKRWLLDSYLEPVQSTSSLFKNHFNIILSTSSSPKRCLVLRLLEWHFIRIFIPARRVCAFLNYATFPTHLIHFYLVVLILSGEEYNLWGSSLCRFQQRRVTLSLLSPNILLKTLFWDTLSVWRLPNGKWKH
jgi:hypothetical protein